jgi:hypothetical protein
VAPLPGENLEINLADSPDTTASDLIITGANDQEVAAFSGDGEVRLSKVVIAGDNTVEETGFDSLSTSYRSNATTGTGTIATGKRQAIIENPHITSHTMVNVTPQGPSGNQVLYVAAKTVDDPQTPQNEASFTVAIESPIDADISFTYWLIETGTVSTSTSTSNSDQTN